jgi:hypothetical protein
MLVDKTLQPLSHRQQDVPKQRKKPSLFRRLNFRYGSIPTEHVSRIRVALARVLSYTKTIDWYH